MPYVREYTHEEVVVMLQSPTLTPAWRTNLERALASEGAVFLWMA
jgi:hypothetical protein